MSAEEDLDALWNDNPPVRRPAQPAVAVALSSDSDDSDEDSVGGGAVVDAAPVVRDYGQPPAGAAAGMMPALPSAAATLAAVAGPPAFLDPEATRPLAAMDRAAPARLSSLAAQQKTAAKGEWDVSRMAPPLAAAADDGPGAAGGVIAAGAVRYKEGDDAAARAVPGGGHVDAPKRKATAAMPVEDFLEKGVGGAQLPRKRQDRKDKEQEKRAKGQSTHAEWKSEAEMALRQQYD